MDIENIINGVNFKKISNVILDTNSIDISRFSQTKNIIFCKIDLVEKLFHLLAGHKSKNILITHQGDRPINYESTMETQGIQGAVGFEKKPDNILLWYAQNVNYKNENLIPLPIGLENHCGPSKGKYIDLKFLKEYNQDYGIKEKILDKVYCNFCPKSHPDREDAKNFFLDTDLGYFDDYGISYKDFNNNLSKYLFVASPRGNGIDCHRTWEALMMGSIPIVKKHFMFDSYKNLPIIQVENWSDLLNTNILNEFIAKYKNGELFKNMEELTMDYWFNKIENSFKFL